MEVLEKSGDFAGDDRTEYKLTPLGVDVRNKLIEQMVKLLEPYIAKIVEGKVKAVRQPIIKDKEQQIENLLMEFSGECEGLVDNDILIQLQEILARLLDNTL